MTQVIVTSIPFVAGTASASHPTVSAATVATMPLRASRRLLCTRHSSTGLENVSTSLSAQSSLRICCQMYVLHFLYFADYDCASSLPLEYGTAGANILANERHQLLTLI